MAEYPINNNFDYHPPVDEDQRDLYEWLRSHYKSLAMDILENCPESRERSVALTELETSMFWANASIARNRK